MVTHAFERCNKPALQDLQDLQSHPPELEARVRFEQPVGMFLPADALPLTLLSGRLWSSDGARPTCQLLYFQPFLTEFAEENTTRAIVFAEDLPKAKTNDVNLSHSTLGKTNRAVLGPKTVNTHPDTSPNQRRHSIMEACS